MDSDENDHGNDDCQKDPPAQLNALFKISNTGCHRSAIETRSAPACSALPTAPIPSISKFPFSRFTNLDSRPIIRARQARVRGAAREGHWLSFEVENNHGSNGYHGYSLVSRHL